MNNWIFWTLITISAIVIYIIGQYGQVPEACPWISVQAKEIIGHMLLYLSLGMLIARYLSGAFGLKSLLLILIVVDICAMFGIYDEFHQGYVKGRGVEVFDVLVDMVGGFLGALIVTVFDKLKRPPVSDPQEEDSLQLRAIKQAVIALHIFVFVGIPAAVYSQDIAQFVTDLRSKLPTKEYQIVRNHQHGRKMGQVPARALKKLPNAGSVDTKHENRIRLSATSDEALSNFAKIANMLKKRNEEQRRRSSKTSSNWDSYRALQQKQ